MTGTQLPLGAGVTRTGVEIVKKELTGHKLAFSYAMTRHARVSKIPVADPSAIDKRFRASHTRKLPVLFAHHLLYIYPPQCGKHLPFLHSTTIMAAPQKQMYAHSLDSLSRLIKMQFKAPKVCSW